MKISFRRDRAANAARLYYNIRGGSKLNSFQFFWLEFGGIILTNSVLTNNRFKKWKHLVATISFNPLSRKFYPRQSTCHNLNGKYRTEKDFSQHARRKLEAFLTPLFATVLQLIEQFNQCIPDDFLSDLLTSFPIFLWPNWILQ